MSKKFLIFPLLLLFFSSFAQVTDDFSDGNFTVNPAWSGDNGEYEVDANQRLHLNDLNATPLPEAYLSTQSQAIYNASWEFWFRIDVNPSSSNQARIYLVSDQADLKGNLNGYYVNAGGSADEISLYRQNGSTRTEIIDGRDAVFDPDTSRIKIRVTRDAMGNWELFSDTSGTGSNFISEGTVLDTTHQQSSWMGVFCDYTSTRKDKFFFDDFVVTGIAIPDNTPPTIDSLLLVSSTSLQLVFSENVDLATAQNTANYSVNNGIGSPQTVSIQSGDSSRLNLNFATPFPNCSINTLSVSNVEDRAANTIAVGSSAPFTWAVTSTASFKAVLINEIHFDPGPPVGLPDAEYVELYNPGTLAFDLGNWTFSDDGSPQSIPSYILCPGEYVLLCSTSDTALFSFLGPTLGVSGFPALNNTGDDLGLRDNNGVLIDTVAYLDTWDPAAGDGISLELINPLDTCSIQSNWVASAASAGGTPGSQNSLYSTAPDTTAPQLISVNFQGLSQITVCFDQPATLASLSNVNNFSINQGIGTPNSVVPVAPNLSCVDLFYTTPLDSGVIYTLTVSGIEDCWGNQMTTTTEDFAQGLSGNPGQVVITEIFPDPSPVVGLPEAEYVEIYNASNQLIDLANWQFGDRGSTNAVFPAQTLFPGDYLVLCPTASVDSFPGLNVLGLSNFPSLNNSGDSLEILNSSGTVVDFAYYSDSWYQDENKEDGGYSLERIDPSYACPSDGNWRASNDIKGGTPGAVNSVNGSYSDVDAPQLDRATLIAPTILRLYFNEEMNRSSLETVTHYSIDQGIGQPLVAIAPSGGTVSRIVDLLLGSPLDSNQVYCITVTDVEDCPGNAIGADGQACFGIPLYPQPGDLVINEILFNPYTGGSDFVELYNRSDKVLDLSDLIIGEIEAGTDSAFNTDQVSDESFLLLPQSYVCLTADRAFQIATYDPQDPSAVFEMSSFPTYDDSEGECVILNDSGKILDRFFYLDDYHFPNLDDKEGVSLERLSFDGDSQDPGNWHSAASTVRYATPGYKNSQLLDPAANGENVWIEPETFSPDLDGMDDLAGIYYRFGEPGTNARVTIFDNRGRLVRQLQQNTLLPTEEGNFTWDGTNDAGNKVPVGIYVILFETSNPNTGTNQTFKLGCVVAARF